VVNRAPSIRASICVLAGAISLVAGRAGADLDPDADELAKKWSGSGQQTTRLPPMFLEQGRPRAVRLPAAALDPKSPDCTTVAFLSGRSTDFVVRVDPLQSPKHHAMGGRFERSIVGAVWLSECGAAREALARLAIELRIARSTVEIVVAVGPKPAPTVAEALPERDSGPVASPADPGPRSPLEPMATRAQRAEQRARNLAAQAIRFQTLTAENDGTGRESISLDEGCHRLELFSDLLAKHPIDLDAEVRDSTTERLLARDRSDAPDVRVDLCVGATTAADLVFAGAPGAVHVTLMDALFPLPRGAPTMWGARARAGVAAALFRRKLPGIEGEPVEQRLGVSGVTSIPISIEPGGCYLSTVAAMRGEPRAITLSAKVDTRITYDATGGLSEGAAVAFCSNGTDKAYFDIEVRGSAVAWVLDVWHMGSRPFDEGR
jgi:hypothetical protein